MKTLEDIYNNSSSVSDIIGIPQIVKGRIEKIAKHCYSQKGVYSVTITLLLYKINHPKQDIRYHQSRWKNGFSGRSYDTEYVTPILAKLKLPAMAESGWLTRSLEQPYPYDLNYKGNISGGLKEDFLQTLDYIEKHPRKAESMLRILLNFVISEVRKNVVHIIPLKNAENLTIEKVVEALDQHFRHNYGTHNGAKLPVLAFHSIYTLIVKEVLAYKGCQLSPLSSLTACDLTSKVSGDIEIKKNNKLHEAIEIKLNKKIDSQIVSVVEKKVYKFNPKRYYVLSYYGTKPESSEYIQEIVARVKREHGCEIIVNGLLTTIKYYLRLISSLQDFINIYTQAVEKDKELMKIHKEVWQNILNTLSNDKNSSIISLVNLKNQ